MKEAKTVFGLSLPWLWHTSRAIKPCTETSIDRIGPQSAQTFSSSKNSCSVDPVAGASVTSTRGWRLSSYNAPSVAYPPGWLQQYFLRRSSLFQRDLRRPMLPVRRGIPSGGEREHPCSVTLPLIVVSDARARALVVGRREVKRHNFLRSRTIKQTAKP
ncbi:hypothetical protein T265_10457 [Opisthorchis viverrini]|uniref:Uncharacterized protein n=1 Tax=Opisthorchis viverrini TaxID=6198 RepID=A0A074Z2B3_OPIVI|nr:hypothetical protein T265_10457 [Opisthorchis viverrini]KER21161.1 hypothetical protein T265_10457 [Opisthorchis viverrini]